MGPPLLARLEEACPGCARVRSLCTVSNIRGKYSRAKLGHRHPCRQPVLGLVRLRGRHEPQAYKRGEILTDYDMGYGLPGQRGYVQVKRAQKRSISSASAACAVNP
jgi:hypothetical protein